MITCRNLALVPLSLVLASGVFTLGVAQEAQGVVIASQDFEGNSLSRGIPRDDIAAQLPLGCTGGDCWYSATGYNIPGLDHDSGVGLGWTSSTDAVFPIGTAPVASSDNGDVMGVMVDDDKDFGTTNGLAGAPGQDGNFYIVEDADSTWTLDFDTVDATGHQNLMLSFIWAVDNDGGGVPAGAGRNFEDDDFFEITINGTSVWRRDGVGDYDLGTATGGLDDLDGPYINAFAPETVDISAFDGQMLEMEFIVANNTAPEDIAFDSIEISGDAGSLPGDADCDGDVDLDDFNILAANFGQGTTVGKAVGDFDGDGDTDLDDFNILAANFGAGVPEGIGSLPEPGSLALLSLGGLAVLRRR